MSSNLNEIISIQPDPTTQETSFQPLSQPNQENRDDSVAAITTATATTTTATSDSDKPIKPPRILAPDLLRGLLILFQSLDHAAVTSGAWAHGTAITSESDSHVFSRWNHPLPWAVRMLTHLCAPGFMFLLGMGVVYFGTSRGRIGWTAGMMARHFLVRAVVLAAVNEGMGLLVVRRWGVVFNIVLLALAVNYLVVGVGWLGLRVVEGWITGVALKVVEKWKDEGEGDGDGDDGGGGIEGEGDSETQPLLSGGVGDGVDGRISKKKTSSTKVQAALISFHVINVFLLGLVGVTLWWNVWFSPTHGHCAISTTPATAASTPSSGTAPSTSTSSPNPWFAFFFYEVSTSSVISPFPPLAWISFSILGALYARIILLKSWTTPRINLFNLLVGLTLLTLFVTTRFFHFGNLDEGCLRMPEQLAHPNRNQYLVGGLRSFMYVTKYPPSPAFGLYTMGINFLFLSAFGFVPAKTASWFPFGVLLTFGTCALFFYALHLPLYGLLGAIVKAIWGREMDYRDNWGRKGDWAIGVPMPVFVLDWVVGLVVLWGLCRWYGAFKRGKSVDSLWRFF